jgi:hypothetical protein
MSANQEWTPKMTCVMILACGLDSSGLVDPTRYEMDDEGSNCTAENAGEFDYVTELLRSGCCAMHRPKVLQKWLSFGLQMSCAKSL